MDLDDFRHVIDINLIGTFNVVRLAAAAMLGNQPADGDREVIVITASIAAYDGQIGQAACAASKGGIVALTLSAAGDLADKLIQVVTASPGTFATPMLAGLADEVTAALEASVPHPSRLGRPLSTPHWLPTSSTTACSTVRSSGSTVRCGCPPRNEDGCPDPTDPSACYVQRSFFLDTLVGLF
jgi:NAD(P)-dependent dehydrogenase (short-subunit alcohol dehydrogenase family)